MKTVERLSGIGFGVARGVTAALLDVTLSGLNNVGNAAVPTKGFETS
ncbi:MAG: hypothetical protein ABI169_01455 [Chitinophagaceae bacterium]